MNAGRIHPVPFLPPELWAHILYFLVYDCDFRSAALVNKTLNALASAFIYQTVSVKTLPTLLAHPALGRHAEYGKFDQRTESWPVKLTDAAAAELHIGSALRDGLDQDYAGAKAALLAHLCPKLTGIRSYLGPADSALFNYYISEPQHTGLPRTYHFQSWIPAEHELERGRPGPRQSFGIANVVRLMALPAVREVLTESVLCDRFSALLEPILATCPPSSVQSLTLWTSQVSTGALVGLLRLAPALETFRFTFCANLREDHVPEPVDFGALGDALVGCPALRTLEIEHGYGSPCAPYVGKLTRLKELPRLRYLTVPLKFLGLGWQCSAEELAAVVPATVEYFERN
jgi:hypothetical protein